MSRIHFPITSVIKYRGTETEKRLDRYDVVQCFYCKAPITVNYNTVVIPGNYDTNKALKCPECGKVVSVLYYYDKQIRKGKR